MATAPRIVVVGGGAGGLELATRLGDRLGRKGRATITLIDRAHTHLWKPLLHEIAAGSMDLGHHELDYLAQAHWHHFRFRIGSMTGLDRAGKLVQLAPLLDESGREILAARSEPYDILVIAVGSLTNDFGTPGVGEHALRLDTPEQAKQFHRRLINACLRAHSGQSDQPSARLRIAIIGAGATGVELAAELRHTTRELVAYGFDRIDPEQDIELHLIEAGDRILPALPPRLSAAASELLRQLGVTVHTAAKVAAVTPDHVSLADGRRLDAELTVWAAGVKAPDFLKDLDGLESNRINQLVVLPSLRTSRDESIFALGDCAACPWRGTEKSVPPRAQAAHQQATHMLRQIERQIIGRPLRPFQYRDFGSLVSLGEYSTVGNLMGALTGRSLMVEGYFARLMYLSLYKLHELALHGVTKVALDTIARTITRRTEPQVKLH